MERKMRRFRQQLDMNECIEILYRASNGVLSLVDTDGTPYGVPVSFAYDGTNSIYLHSATQGHKIDCIHNSDLCSFCVIDRDTIVPEKFTTYFRSVIVRGSISIATYRDEIMKGLHLLCEKYSPGIDSAAEIERCLSHVAVLRIDISGMTGKEAIELKAAQHENNATGNSQKES